MHGFASRVAGQSKPSMDRQRHRRESPISGLTTKLMVGLIVAGMFLLVNTVGSSASRVQNIPDSDVGLGTVVVEGLGTFTHRRSISQRRRLLQAPDPPGQPPGPPNNGRRTPPGGNGYNKGISSDLDSGWIRLGRISASACSLRGCRSSGR